MIRNKLRTSGTTILSALLCVVIGLIIGFLVLTVLSQISKSNDYQAHAQLYADGQYSKSDINNVRKYLDTLTPTDEALSAEEKESAERGKETVLASMNHAYSVDDLYQVCKTLLAEKPLGKKYTSEQIKAAAASQVGEEGADAAVTAFSAAMKEILLKPYEFTFGDVLAEAYEKGFKRVLMGGWYMPTDGGPQMEISNAAPLIMTGLSVAFAFKTGLFNIGAAGQYTLGAFGALLCALVLKLPWWVCILAAVFFGALWGAIPGIFKAYFNVNEVITSIMFNWIGLYGVNTIMYGGGNSPMYDLQSSKTWTVVSQSKQSQIPDLGTGFFVQPASIAIFLAILVAVMLWVVLNKTTFGYELKACGLSKTAAKYAGINEKRNIILSMTIAGALAGLGGALYYLSGSPQWNPQDSTALPAVGFNGISVALLASSSPIGSIFSALFISHISIGGTFMEPKIFPMEVANIISGVIIYLCAFMMLFKNRIAKLFTRKEKGGVK